MSEIEPKQQDLEAIERLLREMGMHIVPRFGKSFFIVHDVMKKLGWMEILREWDRLDKDERDVLLDYAKQLGHKTAASKELLKDEYNSGYDSGSGRGLR